MSSKDPATPKPGNFIHTRTDSGFISVQSGYSIASNQSASSTPYDSTEIVFDIASSKITFEPKKDLTTGNGKPVQGIQTVEIQKWTNVVKVSLGDKSRDEASVDYATIRLPKKVYRNRIRGHYKQLYIRASR
jgi:hypothetical protein